MKKSQANKIDKDGSLKQLRQSGRGAKNIFKKSRFIASAYKKTSVEEKTGILEGIRKEMKKATHNVWALRCKTSTGIWEEFSDDGEVSGCAGKPVMIILQQLQIINVLVVVTRYYGGINLGPAGLIKAYSSTTKELLENIGFEG